MTLIDKIKKEFNNSSDLIIKELNHIHVIYLESICDSDKVNFYILQNISLTKSKSKIISGPNTTIITKFNDIIFYIVNGFAIVIYDKIYAVETRGNIFRGISNPDVEISINGPKDSFNENIQVNLGLIKRRIKSENLVNEDYFLGSITKTKISILYLKNKVDNKDLKKLKNKINRILNKDVLSHGDLKQYLNQNKKLMPTILETQRPDHASLSLLQNKIVILVDNSPFCLILPSYLSDFINPIDDNYQKSSSINFIKVLRFFCFIFTIFAPSLYISLINYNNEIIPLNLLINLSIQNDLVPFPTYVEAIIMLIICAILRESDLRFPSSYGSSISIVGALILGEAAVSAGLISPIMIIIISFTFITSLIFADQELVNALRVYRFIFLLISIFLGIYGLFLCLIIFLISLSNINILDKSYLYPITPYSKKYLFKTLLKEKKI